LKPSELTSAIDKGVAVSFDQRLDELGIQIPVPPRPVANFVPCVQVGDIVHVSGQGPFDQDVQMHSGRLGAELGVEEGYAAARLTILNSLGVIKEEYGSLDVVKRVVKLLGIVNSAENFFDQPRVINGASDLLVEIFGEAGLHARSAIGVNALYSNIPVEIEMIVQLRTSP
jgi:enamine deaminase RidA (YjgF/YER057c/UK114 family)